MITMITNNINETSTPRW